MPTATQLAHACGVTAATVRRWIDRGALAATRGKRGVYEVTARDLERLADLATAQTLESAAYKMGLSRSTLYRRIKAGEVCCLLSPSGRRLVARAEIERIRATRLPPI